ncbi:hypothetical protein MED01_003095 [Micromonospora sp. MED01]|uniref:hypothetical protein n=1 Tax=Micromonospora alfalfae TaxID=2911212 RepID=UPI001EE875CB|nr:hypothetical protein [Micromonospora alfalfae]MCG5464838.1 hypothetical protein [Micromonospora alfalfae]
MSKPDLTDPLALPPDDVPYEGVPDFLAPSLRAWIKETLWVLFDNRTEQDSARQWAEVLALRLRLPPQTSQHGLSPHQGALFFAEREQLLRVVNAILHFAPPGRLGDATERLAPILAASGSAYEVDFGDPPKLVRRIDGPVRNAIQKGQDEAEPTAAQHLRASWLAAFGIEPDPNVAYAEAVRAVEAVACPLVVPPSSRPPTLGNVLTALRGDAQATSPKWELVIPDQQGSPSSVSAVAGMVALLWQGHRSRHAGSESARPNTLEEAEAAYMLAATLVHWLSKGALRARS